MKLFRLQQPSPDSPGALHKEIEMLRSEVKRLSILNRDMDEQIRTLIAAHPMTDEQLAEIASVRQDNLQMRDQINTLTLYCRTRWAEDFQRGLHGRREIAEIVISYLSRLENAAKAP